MEDNLERNHYADHLAEINSTTEVKTSADIVSDKGAIIVPSGSVITREIADKIARFKLSQPLYVDIKLGNFITAKNLHDEIRDLSESCLITCAPKTIGFKQKLVRQCVLYAEHRLVVQKLTVLKERLPDVYRNTLITSCMSLAMCDEMGLNENETHIIYVATLMHDVGLLSIDPELVAKKGKLDRSEWRTLQGHVAIGKIFLDMIPSLPKKVGRAVLEHHERLDGTGYPKGKLGIDICREGQIIALVDTVNAIYHNRLQPLGYSVRDLIPILQMNSHVFPKELHDSFLKILKRSAYRSTRVIGNDNIRPIINFLVDLQKRLIIWFKQASEFCYILSQSVISVRTRQAIIMSEQLVNMINQSGLFTASLKQWLLGFISGENNDDIQELESIMLMFDEFCYQMHQFYKLMDLASHGTNTATEEECAKLSTTLQNIMNVRMQALQNINGAV